jgi:hypothetical protein
VLLFSNENTNEDFIKVIKNTSNIIFKNFFNLFLNNKSTSIKKAEIFEKQFVSICRISRIDPTFSLELIINSLTERFYKLNEEFSKNTEKALYDIQWILIFAGLVLTDYVESENLLIPDELLNYSKSVKKIEDNLIIKLIDLIIKYSTFENQIIKKHQKIMKRETSIFLIKFLNRFIKSYLMNEDTEYDSILNLYFDIKEEKANNFVLFLLNKIKLNLFNIFEEPELSKETITLFKTLTSKKYVKIYLISLDEFKSLLEIDNKLIKELNQPTEVCLEFSECVLKTFSVLENDENLIKIYERYVFTPYLQQLNNIINNKEFLENFENEKYYIHLILLIKKLSSIVSTSSYHTFNMIHEFIKKNKILEITTNLFHKFIKIREVYYQLLIFYKKMIEIQLENISNENSIYYFNHSIQLIKIYFNSNKHLFEKNIEELHKYQFDDILVQLELLTLLISKNFYNFEDNNIKSVNEENINIMNENKDMKIDKILFTGLEIILPLITKDMLAV